MVFLLLLTRSQPVTIYAFRIRGRKLIESQKSTGKYRSARHGNDLKVFSNHLI